MQAFGYLVPSNQQSKILGVVFDSASFPEHDRKDTPSARLTVSESKIVLSCLHSVKYAKEFPLYTLQYQVLLCDCVWLRLPWFF